VPHNTRPKFNLGYVRTLHQQEELRLLRDHLLRLDPGSRRDRFNGFMDDSFIELYAAKCADDGTVIIAYIEDGVVRGTSGSRTFFSDAYVFFVNTDPDWRRRGVGPAVVRLLLDHPSVRHAQKIRLATRDAQPVYARLADAVLEVQPGISPPQLAAQAAAAVEALEAQRLGANLDAVELPPSDSLRDAVSYAIGVLTNSKHRQAADRYLIVDVKIEGVSMVQTYRSEFAEVIQNNGGKVAGLIEALRKKIAQRGAS